MNVRKYLTAAIFAIATIFSLSAETNTMSPYSRYGYGLLRDNASAAQRSMGGVGYAMNSGRQINVMNPASYAAIDTLTFLFDMGIDFTTLWSKEGDKSTKDFGGGLDYITMQFPLGKYMGGSVGLLPYTSVGYSFGSEIENGANSREGLGGINQLYLGVAGRPFKGFSVGANISYLFGTIVNDVYAYTDGGSTSLFERVMEVRDYHLQFGAQYTYNIDKRNRATIGVTYSPGKSFLGHAYGVYYDVNADYDSEDGTYRADTVGYSSLKGNYSRPDTWGVGINYQWDNRLMAEVDFTYQPWSKAKFAAIEGFEQTDFNDRWEVAAGLQFTPKTRGNYAQRINYRCGAFYNNDYIKIGDNSLREYGVSIGFGLPTVTSKTVINLGFEYRHRQANPNPLVKEDFFNITLGINFNELWFWQRKIQ